MTLYLNDLPTEILVAVVHATHKETSHGCFTPASPTIRSLARTSSTLYTFTRPYLYSCIKLQTMRPADRQRSQALFDIMEEYPRRRRWVRYLWISDQGLEDGVQLAAGDGDRVRTVTQHRHLLELFFLELQDLRGIRMLDFAISPNVYVHILELQHLRVFEATRPKFDDSQNATVHITSRSLTHVAILGDAVNPEDSTIEAISRLFLSPKLEHLQYYPASLPILISMIFARNPLQSFDGLLSLCVSEPVDDGGRQELTRLLRACPNLTSLGVLPTITADTEDTGTFQLPSHIIPKLCQYDGPLSIAKAVIPGRPVNGVWINTTWQSVTPAAQEYLRVLLPPMAPIITLHLEVITWRDDFLPVIVGGFGHLENLAIRCMPGQYKVSTATSKTSGGYSNFTDDSQPWSTTIIESLRPLVRLRKLELGTIPRPMRFLSIQMRLKAVSQDTQRERLAELRHNSPSLGDVRLCPRYRWTRAGETWTQSLTEEAHVRVVDEE